MDGILIYFGDAALEEVCHELNALRTAESADSDASFIVFPYPGETWRNELEPGEEAELVKALGRVPSCAVAIACHHGQAARNTLVAVSTVMSKFSNSILDDDFNHLWTGEQVTALIETEPNDGLFAFQQVN
jgi:agmatine/peptidylarginine deiminase